MAECHCEGRLNARMLMALVYLPPHSPLSIPHHPQVTGRAVGWWGGGRHGETPAHCVSEPTHEDSHSQLKLPGTAGNPGIPAAHAGPAGPLCRRPQLGCAETGRCSPFLVRTWSPPTRTLRRQGQGTCNHEHTAHCHLLSHDVAMQKWAVQLCSADSWITGW